MVERVEGEVLMDGSLRVGIAKKDRDRLVVQCHSLRLGYLN